jgi:ABC-type transport system substrate-binding protein
MKHMHARRPFRPDRRQASRRLAAAAASLALPVGTPALAAPQDGVDGKAAGSGNGGNGGNGAKVLRYAFRVAETSMDPVKISDLYSRTLTPHIFEALYKYDHLARPVRIVPLTAEAMPEHSADFRTWTIRVRGGIYFAADPAFKGRRRELVAQDYVYAWKRFADPANKAAAWSALENEKFLGLSESRKAALDGKKPYDYDRELEGLRAIDRYTLQFTLEEARPRFVETIAGSDLFGAVAREVVEHYGEQIDGHPVGTGPFKLAQWRRSSFIAFDRNPDFREMFYDAQPAADDAEGQALAARFKGRRLPMVDRVEISIVNEDQPRWLSFLNGEADFVERVSFNFIHTAMPGGKVAPNLAKRGIRGYQQVEPGSTFFFFNMEDPVFGGYTPERIALRRAVGLAMDTPREIRLLRKGQAILAQSPLLPGTSAYDPKWRSEFGEFDPARAQALLDIHGYVDRNGDGWREQPSGEPLLLPIRAQPDQTSREIDDLVQKNLKAVGIRVAFQTAQWPENLKAARAGSLTAWSLGSSAAAPDSLGALARYDSRQVGGQNLARFRLKAFDEIYERLQFLPDGPERAALFDRANRLAVAYMPYKYRVCRILTDMTYPWMIGYRRTTFWQEWWHYVDIDRGAAAAA